MTKIIAPPGAPQAQLHQVRWPYFQPQQQATSRPCTTQTMAYSRHYTMYQPTSWIFIQPLDFSISIHLNSTLFISHISKTELPEGCSQVSSTQPISQGHLCLLHLQVSASGAKNSSFQPLSKSASRAKSHRPSFGCHQRTSTPELPQWPILLFMAPRTRRFVPRPRRLPKIGQI